MNINPNTLVSDIVSENYKTAETFKLYGIDFCCNGNRSLQEVSEKKQIDLSILISKIKNDNEKSINTNHENFQNWELDFLSDYIYQNHHTYIERKGPEILAYLNKISSVHGKNHPELYEVALLFKEALDDLTIHMKKEELILFPYIKKIANSHKNNEHLSTPPFSSISNPIEAMHNDHDNEGERFRKISELTNNYKIPNDACNTYKIAFSLLKDFEEDLHKHIHLENNILFKRAITLENKLNNKN